MEVPIVAVPLRKESNSSRNQISSRFCVAALEWSMKPRRQGYRVYFKLLRK